MVSRILGVLMLVAGLVFSFDLVGALIVSAVALVGLVAKLVLSGMIAYIGYRLVTGAHSVSS